jgi:hypothetical protein
MIFLHPASAAETQTTRQVTPNALIAAYSDGDAACKQNASMQGTMLETMQAMRQLLET